MYSIQLITENKERYLPLLAPADESEESIRRVLAVDALYVLHEHGADTCAATVRLERDACELTLLATDAAYRGKGYASLMLEYLFFKYAPHVPVMRVGTGEPAVPFYEKHGFVRAGTDKGYFVREYPAPIYENGVQLVDRVLLERLLKTGCCCHS